MDRITRKSLKDDRFAAEVTHSVEYIAGHRRQALLYGGVAVAVLAVAGGVYFYRQNRQTGAHDALSRALETHRGVVAEEDRPGRVTFRTAAEKNNRAIELFNAVSRKYSGAQESKIARYYTGLVLQEMGKPAEAQKVFEQLAGEGNDQVGSLARLGLGAVLAAQGKDQEARKAYEYLIQNPTDTVSDAQARLALARLVKNHKPEEARQLLEELRKRPGSAAAAAAGVLGEIGAK